MGQTISITPVVVDSKTKVYYASAKFRELQIDRLLENRPFEDFPTKSNMFVTEDYDTALLYSWKRDDPSTYYSSRADGPPKSVSNLDVIHVYETVGEQNLIDISDPDVLRYLLFEDSTSPFHISKQEKSYVDVNIFSHRKAAKGRFALKKFEEKLNKHINPFGGFGTLSGVTNYHNYYLSNDSLNRVSVVDTDYVIATLLKEFAGGKYDGWVQPKDSVFHQEYMFFNPEKSLRPLYSDPKEWINFWIHPNVLKENTFSLSKKIKETLMGLEESFAEREKKSRDIIREYQEILKHPSPDDIEEYDGLEKFINEMNTQIREEEEKLADAKNKVIKNVQSQLIPYLKGAGKLLSVFSPTQQFYNKSNNRCNFESSCKTPLSFEQCQTSLDEIAEQMGLFPNKITNHHVGETVADHSIWVARTIYKWLSYQNNPWVKDIWPELRNTTLLSAFTHDIGKIGDMDMDTLAEVGAKRDHPLKGYLYFVNALQFKTTDNGFIKTTSLIDAIGCRYNKTDTVISAVVAGMHHYLGELLLSIENFYPTNVGGSMGALALPFSFDYERYLVPDQFPRLGEILDNGLGEQFKYIIFLHKLLVYLDNVDRKKIFFKKEAFLQLLHILFAISAADNYGAYPVQVSREEDSVFTKQTSDLLDPEFLFKTTNVSEDANIVNVLRPYYKYLYHSTGLVEKEKMIEFALQIKNFDIFLEAWNQFDRFMMYIENRAVNNLPNIYRYLSPQDFSTSLINLLRWGKIPLDSKRLEKLPDAVLDNIREEDE